MGDMQRSKLSKRRSLKLVKEEYNKALHAKSYVDTYSRLQTQLNLNRTSTTTYNKFKQDHTMKKKMSTKLRHIHSSLLSYGSYDDSVHDLLLERSQEPLLTSTTSSSLDSDGRFHLHLNKLLLDFFDVTLQATTACISILSLIDRARAHHHEIYTLLHATMFSELSSHLEVENPLSANNLSHFHHIHSRCPMLTHRLASAYRKICQRIKLVKFTKKATGIASIAGACSGLGSWPRRWFKGWVRLERAKAMVDAATKGAYVVERDLDTMSQMLRRIHDEVEHKRDVAKMVMRNREYWETVMREMVDETEGRREDVGLGFEEGLRELEEHVYLCLTTINKSRRLVAHEMA